MILKDVTVDTMPWCMIRFDGVREGNPVCSEKKLAFSEIPNGMAANKDFYVFWSEVNG